MASDEEVALRKILGIPTKGTIGDLRKSFYRAVKNGTIVISKRPPVWSSGSNPYDATLLSTTIAGDMFFYDKSGAHPGWLYQRNPANTDWTYVGALTVPTT